MAQSESSYHEEESEDYPKENKTQKFLQEQLYASMNNKDKIINESMANLKFNQNGDLEKSDQY